MGNHDHCFCNEDTGGDKICCRCGIAMTSCDECAMQYCVIRDWLGKGIPIGAGIFVFDCPLATSHYRLLYRRVTV